jgi:uncharacterized protein YacL
MESEEYSMLKKISGFAVNAVLSAGIGFLVGILLIILPASPIENKSYLLLISTGIGILIGVASRFSSCIVYHYGFKSPYWSYGLTFLITLAGCTLISNPFNPEKSQLLLSIVIAEPLALMAAYLNIRYADKLNDSLKRKQAQLKERQHK